jgi:RNA polymerase sigma-70 factor, ECF subfamily
MEPVAAVGAVPVESSALNDFEAVVQLYWPRVFRYVLGSLRDRDAAQTLAQECFLRAYRSRDRFRGESSISTWLMQIAVNLVRDEVRSRRWKFWRAAAPDQPAMPDHAAGPERVLLARERVDAVWRAASRLPEQQRTVFLLRFVEEMELLEIAAAAGMSESAVKVQLYRAIRTVRRRVGGGV